MRRFVVPSIVMALLVGAAVVAGFGSGHPASARAKGLAALKPIQQRLVDGLARRALQAPLLAPNARRAAPSDQRHVDIAGCPRNRGADVRVNQDCENQADPDLQGRSQGQNETTVAQDPNAPRHMVAGANDYRRGDSNCYPYYSRDDGRTWQDSTMPTGFTRGTAFGGAARQYWQAAGDPSVAWDSRGNAYFACLMFQRGQPTTPDADLSSAFYLFRSTGTDGASWNFPGRPIRELNDTAGTGTQLLDKPYMAIDNHKGSRYQDRIYVTWTFFAADGTAYIYEAYSSDYGERFSSPHLVSRTSSLCSDTLGTPTPNGTCNENQFSQPFTGPDGNLYVVWDNYNLTQPQSSPGPADNRAQVLLAKSTDGGASFSAPVKVSNYYDLPDCVTYQGTDAGVACVPEKGDTQNSIFRAANYPVGGVNPSNPREIDVTVASYINRHSNESNGCVPQGYNPDTLQPLYQGVKKPGACNNDIVLSRSLNGGRTFTGTRTNVRRLPSVRPNDPRADQFWQWAAFDPKGRLAVSYYDRAYGTDETTGFSDITLSGSRDLPTFGTRRVTTASMPPATQFEGDFFGDYAALSAQDNAHPVWMDTRDPNLFVCRDSAGQVTLPPSLCTASAPNAAVANDENVYTRSLAIPTR